MRPELLDPLRGNSKLQAATLLAEEIYRLHEAGKDYSNVLSKLIRLSGRVIGKFDVHSNFGTVDAEAFARDLLIDWDSIPSNLTREEMLELAAAICEPQRNQEYLSYWIACLRVNTGDDRISDLIYWPGDYFGDGDNKRELSPEEILDTALAAGAAQMK